jgi:hypothetical protein
MKTRRLWSSSCAALCLSLPPLVAGKGQEKGNVSVEVELARNKPLRRKMKGTAF